MAVIPARFASTRLPGKPLIDLAGQPMIVRVGQRAQAARRVDRVVIATDDARIAEVARGAGFEVAMTPSDCPSGSDRVAAAVVGLSGPEPALVVNVQGDEPLIDPADIDALVDASLADPEAIGTLARPLLEPRRFADPNVVKVVRGVSGRALYFSRAPIPHGHADGARAPEGAGPLQHVGLYAYSPALLARFTGLDPSPLERQERLEQLRALENGVPIRVTMCVSERPSLGVDTPEDVEAVVRALGSEGSSPVED